MPGMPLDFSEVERLPASPAPQLGRHTDKILLEVLRFSEAEVGTLHDEGITAQRIQLRWPRSPRGAGRQHATRMNRPVIPPVQFYEPLTIGAPLPLRELLVRPERVIHLFPPHIETIRVTIP